MEYIITGVVGAVLIIGAAVFMSYMDMGRKPDKKENDSEKKDGKK